MKNERRSLIAFNLSPIDVERLEHIASCDMFRGNKSLTIRVLIAQEFERLKLTSIEITEKEENND